MLVVEYLNDTERYKVQISETNDVWYFDSYTDAKAFIDFYHYDPALFAFTAGELRYENICAAELEIENDKERQAVLLQFFQQNDTNDFLR